MAKTMDVRVDRSAVSPGDARLPRWRRVIASSRTSSEDAGAAVRWLCHRQGDVHVLDSTDPEEATMATAKEILKRRTVDRERLEKEAPNLYNGFNELMKQYYKPSALDRKYKELMAVTASVATRCIPCLANHMNNAVSAGATRDEVIDAAAIGTLAGPRSWWCGNTSCHFLDDPAKPLSKNDLTGEIPERHKEP